jgi:cytochrome P450
MLTANADTERLDAETRRVTNGAASWTGWPSGPRLPPFLQSVRYMLGPYESIEANRRRFGNTFTIQPMTQPRMVVFSDPEEIRQIFTADPGELVGGEPAARLLGPILGWNSLVVLDGDRYLRHRRLMMPPLHHERMPLYFREIVRIADQAADQWPLAQPFKIHSEVRKIMLEVLLRTIFGFEGEKLAQIRSHLGRIVDMVESPFAGFIFLPTLRLKLGGRSPWSRFLRLRSEMASLLSEEIARCRRQADPTRIDVLSLLVAARDEAGAGMTEQELFDEMFTLLMAGSETTATSLVWLFYHLLARADVMAKVRAERDREMGRDGRLSPEHVQNLHYLDAVIKESARLTPVTTDVARILKQPKRIGGLDLPAGAGVSAGIYLVHHRPDVWPDPERFDPERFIGARPDPYAFFPFGGGERRCIGAAYATYVMKIIIAHILSRLEMRLAPGYRMHPAFHAITIAPSGGTPVIVDRRAPSAHPA